jgi:hypothetical protein
LAECHDDQMKEDEVVLHVARMGNDAYNFNTVLHQPNAPNNQIGALGWCKTVLMFKNAR